MENMKRYLTIVLLTLFSAAIFYFIDYAVNKGSMVFGLRSVLSALFMGVVQTIVLFNMEFKQPQRKY